MAFFRVDEGATERTDLPILYQSENSGRKGFAAVRPLEIPSAEEMDRCWNNGVAMDK